MLGGDEFISSPPRKTVRFGGTLTDILLKYEKVTAAPLRRPWRLSAGGFFYARLPALPVRSVLRCNPASSSCTRPRLKAQGKNLTAGERRRLVPGGVAVRGKSFPL